MLETGRICNTRVSPAQVCEKYHRQGFACSESVFRALVELYDIEVSDVELRAVAAFAGGAAQDGRCGALEAGLLALGVLWRQGRVEIPLDFFRSQVELQQIFSWRHGNSTQCKEIFYPLYERYIEQYGNEDGFHCAFWSGVEACCEFFNEKVEIKRRDDDTISHLHRQYSCGVAALLAFKRLGFDVPTEAYSVAVQYARGYGLGGRCAILEAAYLLIGLRYGRLQGGDETSRKQVRSLNAQVCEAFAKAVGMTECREICHASNGVTADGLRPACDCNIWEQGIRAVSRILRGCDEA